MPRLSVNAFLFRLMARLPLGLLHFIGAFLGWLTYAASPSYRRRLRDHVAQAGLPWAAARPAVAAAGRMVAELPWLWSRPAQQPLGDRVQWQGAEHLDAALATGRGLVMLTPHLGCFEIIAQAYAGRWGAVQPMTALYRPARQPWLRALMEAGARERPGLLTAPATLAGVRQMIRALRAGGTIGLLPDQVPPEGLGVWAPFFGRPAYTMTLASRLVQQTGADWLLLACERLPHGRGYIIRVTPPPEALPPAADGAEAAAGVINRAMEGLIRAQPGQYLWGYHRYKAPRGADLTP
jgi:Kdo2-lipid IVA lauroyltransferase/acyltransferase